MYRKQVEVRPFDETEADHGYAETDPTGRYGRVSFSLLFYIIIIITIYVCMYLCICSLHASVLFSSSCNYFYKLD
jgi:hypothetical protein